MANYAITTAAASLEFDTTQSTFNSCNQVDSNHFINFWKGAGNDGFVQVFTVDTSTWVVTTANSSLEFDTVNGDSHENVKVDSNHFINFWEGNGNNGFAQVFTVNTSTWAVTTANSSLEFDTQSNSENAAVAIDSSHILNTWRDALNDGSAQIFIINTSTWAITTAQAPFKWDGANDVLYRDNYLIDSNHVLQVWYRNAVGTAHAQVLTINTSTWEITTAASALEFDAAGGSYICCEQVDANHFIVFWADGADDGFVQVLTVNTSTWAVTTAAASLEFDTQQAFFNSCNQIDTNHFINFWMDVANQGRVQAFAVNTSTWAVTTAAASFNYDTSFGYAPSCYEIESGKFINFWGGSGIDGYTQVFDVEGVTPPVSFIPQIIIT